jgi:hypothetical protein
MDSLRRCSGSTSSSKEGVEEEEDKGNIISTSARNCWHSNENKFDTKFQFLLESRTYRYSSVLVPRLPTYLRGKVLVLSRSSVKDGSRSLSLVYKCLLAFPFIHQIRHQNACFVFQKSFKQNMVCKNSKKRFHSLRLLSLATASSLVIRYPVANLSSICHTR